MLDSYYKYNINIDSKDVYSLLSILFLVILIYYYININHIEFFIAVYLFI